jgi:hypothetical protein
MHKRSDEKTDNNSKSTTLNQKEVLIIICTKKMLVKKKKNSILSQPNTKLRNLKKKTKIVPGQPELACKTCDPIHKVRIA